MKEIDDKLLRLNQEPSQEEISSEELYTILDTFNLALKPVNFLEGLLRQDGFTGQLIQAAKRIDRSISNVDRHLLSRDGILYYVAFRAIKGLGVEDVSGIVSNMLTSLDKVKATINRDLVERVITAQNLNVSEEDKTLLKDSISKIFISYEPDSVSPFIFREIEKLKEGGGSILTVSYTHLTLPTICSV